MPTHWVARLSQSELVFPYKGVYYRKQMLLSYISWLVSDDPAGEEAGCGGSGLAWLHLVWGCEASWTYC